MSREFSFDKLNELENDPKHELNHFGSTTSSNKIRNPSNHFSSASTSVIRNQSNLGLLPSPKEMPLNYHEYQHEILAPPPHPATQIMSGNKNNNIKEELLETYSAVADDDADNVRIKPGQALEKLVKAVDNAIRDYRQESLVLAQKDGQYHPKNALNARCNAIYKGRIQNLSLKTLNHSRKHQGKKT